MRSSSLRWTALLCGLGCAACASSDSSKDAAPSVPKLEPLVDMNEAADVVEVSLIAGVSEMHYLPAGPAEVWAYRDGSKQDARGVVPGPLIEAHQGDRVIVHFRNELPEGTTIHWHGVRVPNEADGSMATQDEIPPGGEYTYEFVLQDEGTFWYHPHVRGDTQVERGLHGMILVHGGPQVPVDRERTLVLDDVKLKASGVLSTSTTSLDIMLGRQGNFIVANGVIGGVLEAAAHSRERWHLVNTANGRYFNLRVPGHRLLVIGWDGGLLAEPYRAETLLITPGERYDVVVELEGMQGEELALETIHYDRGHEVPDPGPQPVLHLRLGKPPATPQKPLPTTWGAPVELEVPEHARERELVLKEEEIDDSADVRFTINDQTFPDVPPIMARAGAVEIWRFDNQSEMDHPFHLHGIFFRVLDVNGVEPEQLGWKDTVNIPQKAQLRLALRYGEPGVWMYHCHILEHQERGMMGALVVSRVAAIEDATDRRLATLADRVRVRETGQLIEACAATLEEEHETWRFVAMGSTTRGSQLSMVPAR
jgi:FtsP/CotA-like multicopper oxidase with cupredoxin domain